MKKLVWQFLHFVSRIKKYLTKKIVFEFDFLKSAYIACIYDMAMFCNNSGMAVRVERLIKSCLSHWELVPIYYWVELVGEESLQINPAMNCLY